MVNFEMPAKIIIKIEYNANSLSFFDGVDSKIRKTGVITFAMSKLSFPLSVSVNNPIKVHSL